jgi:predicted SPOUT superfamily RNA methylase MTH1
MVHICMCVCVCVCVYAALRMTNSCATPDISVNRSFLETRENAEAKMPKMRIGSDCCRDFSSPFPRADSSTVRVIQTRIYSIRLTGDSDKEKKGADVLQGKLQEMYTRKKKKNIYIIIRGKCGRSRAALLSFITV